MYSIYLVHICIYGRISMYNIYIKTPGPGHYILKKFCDLCDLSSQSCQPGPGLPACCQRVLPAWPLACQPAASRACQPACQLGLQACQLRLLGCPFCQPQACHLGLPVCRMVLPACHWAASLRACHLRLIPGPQDRPHGPSPQASLSLGAENTWEWGG